MKATVTTHPLHSLVIRSMSTLFLITTLSFGCEEADRCTVNVECGTDHLCRAGECKPKCNTYLTCEEGEACIDGACEVPTADYCSHIVPAMTPPEMGPYAPCPPSEMAGETAGGMSNAAGETPAPAGEAAAGEAAAGEAAAGEAAAGEAAAGEAAAGEAAAGEAAAGEAAAGEAAAGDVIEVIGGENEG